MSLMSFSVDSTGRASRAKWGRRDLSVHYKPDMRSVTSVDQRLAGDFSMPRSSSLLAVSGLHLKQPSSTMNHTGGHIFSSSSSFSVPQSNLSPASSPPALSPSTAPFLSLELQAQFQNALRSMKSRSPFSSPVSLQESSTIAFSSAPITAPAHCLLQKEPCAQSQPSPPPFLSDSSYRSPASAFDRDVKFTDLPIVRGPAAFQGPSAGAPLQAGNSASSVSGVSAMTADTDSMPVGAGSYRRDEECKRLKRTLEELERELMGDDSDLASSVFDFEPLVASEPLERDWTDVIEDLLSGENSSFPVHSVDASSQALREYSTVTSCSSRSGNDQSSEATVLRNSVSKPEVLAVQSFRPASDVTSAHPKQLLLACASAIDADNFDLAKSFLTSLRQSVSIFGDPIQRLAAYMADGLAARIQSFCGDQARAVKLKDFSGPDILLSRQILDRCCPFYRFGYVASNGAIAEAFRTEAKVHIIDFNIGQGNQWQGAIDDFARRPGGPPCIRITAVDDAKFPEIAGSCLEIVGRQLKDFAENARVPLEFNAVPVEVSQLQPWMLETKPGEALAVSFAFQLHHMPDESVSTTNPRDRLLRLVRAMEPKLVTLVEHEANTNTAPFYPRFVEALSYFAAVFDSLEALPRDSRDRLNVEQLCLARDIVNIIACEGSDRTERYEPAGKWRARMTMAGFQPLPLSSPIQKNVSEILQKYSHKYRMREEMGAFCLDWLDRPLVVASAWQ